MQKIKLKIEPSLSIKHEAFAYQAQAVNELKELEYAAIFHEQGLGKSKIAIDLMLYWLEKKEIDTVLFVVKKALIRNWEKEFLAHSYIKPKILSQKRSYNYYIFNSPSRLILTHYEVLRSENSRLRLFLKTRNVAAILDESTRIKNPESSVAKSAFELSPLFKKRIIMTGTPIANRPYDIWAQIWFLDHGESLGENFREFKTQADLANKLYEDEEGQAKLENFLDKIFKKISHFSVRETKTSGVIELPNKEIATIETDWEPRQYELYAQIKDNTRAIIIKEGVPVEDNADDLLKRLLRLVQVASNPRLIDESYSLRPGKYEYLLDLVTRICGKNEKCIIWTSFVDNVDWLNAELKTFGTCKVHGKMTIEARDMAIEKFLSNDKVRVLVATPGAAKEGLTLTVANNVIFYDRTFSLEDYLQAQDRIHRISQKKNCFVYNLIMKDSIDEWVDILLQGKHLAAQLAQGDISHEYYKSQISYEFGYIVRKILNIENK